MPKSDRKPPVIFLSYSKKDLNYAKLLYEKLKGAGLTPWLDRIDIKPGEKWVPKIKSAIESADFFLACLSKRALDSEGFQAREIEWALERQLRKPHKNVYLIPVFFEDCELPEKISDIQAVKFFETNGFEKLLRSLKQEFISSESKLIGRQDKIDKIIDSIKDENSVAIVGMAGIGKSTVLNSVRMAIDNNRPGYSYSDVFHRRITEQDSKDERISQLLNPILMCLNRDAIPVESENLDARFAQVQREMDGRKYFLSVDNADDPESREAVKAIDDWFDNLTIAVTSRHADWPYFVCVPIEGMNDDEGVALFKREYDPDCDTELVRLICRKVEGHPMMIIHRAEEAKIPNNSLLEMATDPREFKLKRELRRRFDAIFKIISKDCHKVLFAIGIVQTAMIRVDLIRQVADVKLIDLEKLEAYHLINLYRNNTRIWVHELTRAWCRELLNFASETHADLLTKTANFYCRFLHQRRRCTAEDLREIDDEWPNIIGLIDALDEEDEDEDEEKKKQKQKLLKLVDEKILLELFDKALGDHFEDPNGYIPRRRKISPLTREPKQEKSRSRFILILASRVGGLLRARIEKNLGLLYYWQGNYDHAMKLFLRAKEIYENKSDTAGAAAATLLLGYIADDENRYQDAKKHYDDGTKLCKSIDPPKPEFVATGHHLIGCTLYHRGHFDEALKEFRRADKILNKILNQRPRVEDSSFSEDPIRDLTDLKVRNDRRFGAVALRRGDLAEAQKIFESVQELLTQVHRPRDAARIARHLGELYLDRGDLETAATALQEALEGFEKLGAVRGIGSTRRCLATLHRKQGNFDKAIELCEQSRMIAKDSGSYYGRAAACEELSEILKAKGEPEKAVNRQKSRARNIYKIINHNREEELTQHLEEIGGMVKELPDGIKGVLFDLMDTLAKLEKGIYQKTQERFANLMGVSTDRFQLAWTHSREDASTGIFESTEDRLGAVIRELGANVSETDLARMAEEMEMMWQNHVRLFRESKPLLKELRTRGIKSAIVSNGPVAMNSLRESLGLNQYVDAFVLSCQVVAKKPDRAIYEEALKRLKLDAAQCIFVGDGNDRELDGARDVGLFTVKIDVERPPYGNLKNESIDWDIEVKNLGQLRALFKKTGNAASS
jgi:HAD superfamily hydrolase (TIGR01549 family)